MTEQFDFGNQIVWRPTPEYIENAHLTRFMRKYNVSNFEELMRRSTEDVAWFTESLLNYLDIQFYEPYSNIVDLSRGIAWPKWCVDGKMNIVHNCLDKYIGSPVEDRTAVIWEGEEGRTINLSYGELNRQVNQMANALRSLGLGKGDAIGIYMPMTPEIVVALLAIAKIGGVILPLFSGYGVSAVVTRLADADAKALFTADGFRRRGKAVLMKPVADQAATQVTTLEHMIVLSYAGLEVKMSSGRDHWWGDLIEDQPQVAETEVTLAEDILMIIYTSGTTGKPKGAVHTHCSFPVKASQDMAFGTDLHPGQVIYWMTDMGWMMGPWLVFGSLILGGTLFIYDGAPDYPGPDRTWDMVERHKITTLGISPTFIRAMIRYGDGPIREHDLSSLHIFASTGEPWNPDPWMWLFEVIGQRKLPIINYSGGTEIAGGIVMGNPLIPIKPCALTAPCPGIAADVFDENGQPVRGKVGELVIKAPWIGMTRGFWKDPQRYEETYWSRWPGVWVHGDFAIIDEDDQWYILGRSDDTIKVAGKRLGPAEVESILVSHPDVIEAAVIGAPDEIKGNVVVAFCVLVEGCEECDELRQELNQLVITALGKPLALREIRFISDLPKTRNAKVMRRMIRSAYLGETPGDTSSLVNPHVVDEIRRAK
jgi:acetyl-CoA synthetase